MTALRCFILAVIALLLATPRGGAAQADDAGRGIRLGFTTHFAQGWPPLLYNTVARFPGAPVREAIAWSAVEKRAGDYRFTQTNAAFIDRLCGMRRRVLLVILPHNRIYDGGKTVTSLAAREAFGRFVATVAERYRDCVDAIEIGNEINGPGGLSMRGPDRPAAYAAILQTLYPIVKARRPDVAILGGSTNLIGTGFLDRLFAAGAMPFVDGVVVHPYRAAPENVDWEVARLRSAMAARGSVKPIWVTEFGLADPDPERAADYLVKMVTLMSAAGVADAYWYALADDRWFPTMGLATAVGGEKPGGTAFAHFARNLAGRGAAVRLNPDDTDVFHFAFGTDRQLVWGLGRSLIVDGDAVFRDATGAVIDRPSAITDRPVIVEGKARLTFGPGIVLADSLYNFAREPWSYAAIRGVQPSVALRPVDGTWTSFLGAPGLPQLAVNQLALRPIGKGPGATRIAISYRATTRETLYASACFAAVPGGAGGSYRIQKNASDVGSDVVAPRSVLDVPVSVEPGDLLTYLITSPGGASPPMRYRLRIARETGLAPTC